MATTRFTFNFVNVEILYNNPLGSGAYGAVYKAKCDKLPSAAKILHGSFIHMPDTLERFRQECDFLESIKHPNIVQFLGLYSDPKTKQTALIMELMDESLTSFLDRYNSLGKVPYHLQVEICHSVVLALHYLHTNQIIHRDLSSNNVLLLGGCIAKVTDLGVSRIQDAIQQQKMTQCPGSPVYMPPEALRLQPVYSQKLDSFSFGVLVIQMETRRFPNPESHEVLIADASSPTGYVSMPVKESDRREKDISIMADNSLKTVALQCIEDIATQRPSSAELCDTIEGIKTSIEYQHSKSSSQLYDNKLSNDQVVESLQSEIREYRDLLAKQHTTGDKPGKTSSDSASIPSLTVGSLRNENLGPLSLNEEEGQQSTKIISNLSPDTVMLLSKNDIGNISGVIYHKPRPDCITVMSASNMHLNAMVKEVMAAYQKMASTPSQLSFVNVPEYCPIEEVNSLVTECNMLLKPCGFSYLNDINAIQVVSTQQSCHGKAVDHIKNTFRLTIYLSGGRKLELKKADITKETVNVLVTATNRYMTPSGGMCKAVNAASKGKIGDYCREYIDKRDGLPLEECDIATTRSGGDLKCSWVVHALGPDGAKHSSSDCQKMTMNLIQKCLVEGNRLNAKSIALPAISTGHHHVKTKVAANGIITAVLDFDFHEHHTLRDIRIVIVDDRTFNEFVEVFEERLVDAYGQSHASGYNDKSTFVEETGSIYPSAASSCRQS